MKEVEDDPTAAAKCLKDKGYQSVYVHIDLDALDPEEFPYAPVPEPYGLAQTFIKKRRLGLLEYSGTKK